MTLTKAAILENIGMLEKKERGQYSLGLNAKSKFVFMYGDALTVSLYGSIYDRILRQLTQLGNEDYI